MAQKKKAVNLVSVSLGIAIVLSFHLTVFFLKPPSANKVFTNNTASIVELKCVTENIG